MLTSQQFRENARQNLADARTLLPTSPKNAAYLAGYSIEFILKARYCSLRNWAFFPRSPAELREWNKRDGVEMKDTLFVHDLDTLLRLCDAVQFRRTSFPHINWDRARDWSEQIRYQPVESITQADAESLIAESEKLISGLIDLEILNVIWSIEVDVSRKYGLFHCFALVIHPTSKEWVLLVSWCARTQEEWSARKNELDRQLDELLAPDLRSKLSDIQTLNPQAPLLQGLYVMLNVWGGILHSPQSTFMDNVVEGYPKLPDGYIITAGNWSPELLEKAWGEATNLNNEGQ